MTGFDWRAFTPEIDKFAGKKHVLFNAIFRAEHRFIVADEPLIFNLFNEFHTVFRVRPKTEFKDGFLECLLAAVVRDQRPRLIDVNVSPILRR